MLIAGVDEVGRGPIAGPVVAAAAIPNGNDIPGGIADSKTLSHRKREILYPQILAAFTCSIASVDVTTIDRINIRAASLLAMRIAIENLESRPELALVDGRDIPPGLEVPAQAIIRGDSRCPCIAAASIVAKVVRDRYMRFLSIEHPHYGWDRNAGYPTRLHLTALSQHGITRHHRRSFRPVSNLVSSEN